MELSVNEIPTLLTKEQKIARNVDGHFDVYCLCRCCNNALMAVTVVQTISFGLRPNH